MKKAISLLWKRSPVKILLFVTSLLIALGYFESLAQDLRSKDIIIQITNQNPFYVPDVNQSDFEEDFPLQITEEWSVSWYNRISSEEPDILRTTWDKFLLDNPEKTDTFDAFLIEIRIKMKESRYNEAYEELRAYTPDDAHQVVYYFSGAILENHLGLYSEALDSYGRVIEISPNNYAARYNIGTLYYNLGRFSLARTNLEEAISLAGGLKRAQTYRILGQTFVKLGDYISAEEALHESILLDPGGVDSRIILADLYIKHLDNITAAEELLSDVQKLKEDSSELYILLSEIDLAENNIEKALQTLEDAKLKVSNPLPVILEIAKIHLETGNPANAKKITEEGLVLYPDNPSLLFQLGRSFYQNRDFQAAEDSFRKAIAVSKDPFLEAVNNLGLVLMARENWQEAGEQFDYAIEMNPWYEVALYNRGLVYLNLEDLHKAKESFEEAVRIDSEHQAAWYNLGIVYGNLGEASKAAEAYEKALLIDPDDIKARLNLAVQYKKLGNIEHAQEQYQLVLNLNPRYASAWYNLALLQKSRNDYVHAEESYRKAIELEPEEEIYWLNLSALLGFQDKTDEAIAVLNEALDIHSNSAVLRYNLAIQYEELGRYQDSIEQVKLCIEINPEYTKGWLFLGKVYSSLGYHEESLSAYRKAAVLDTEDSYINYLIGKELYDLKEYEASVVSIELALENNQDNAFIWYNAGKAYQELGNQSMAEKYYEKSLDIDPAIAKYLQEELETLDESDALYISRMESDPDNPYWPLQLAKLYIRQEQLAEAQDILIIASSEFQTDSDILMELAYVYEIQDMEEEAQEIYLRIIKLYPGNASVYFNIGKSYKKSENWEAAKDYLTQGLQINASHPDILYLLGDVYYELEDYPSAVYNFKQSLNLDSSKGDTWLALGKAQYRQKLYSEAESSFERALDIFPNYVWSYIWYGRSLRKQERFSEAEQSYLKGIEANPKEPQVYIAMGDLFREKNNNEKARDYYNQALQLDPTNNTLLRRIESVSP